jgi:hypothetical protein
LPTPSAEFTDVPNRELFLARREREKAKGRNGNGFGLTLPMALALLPTPRASENETRTRKRTPSQEAGQHGLYLQAEVLRLLPTPVKGDAKNARQSTAKNPRSPHHTLADLAYLWSGGSTKRRSSDGSTSSAPLDLSPWFVEWMMGAPEGWSDPDCPLSATEFSSRPDGCAADESSSTRQRS